ncbi:hypothetical protein CRG98_018679 [Punica granatum]|uniref:Reverse transcriptase domain-containing protein n=1 Tax=Punica granatum TaxID=22663 RepID=A0A2I0JYP2_PUNGR|nr:hypothetical protein CRG98_018679 [Punica granatum]
MHVRGARCTRRATGVHGRCTGARVGARACAAVRAGCARVRERARGLHTAGTFHPRVTNPLHSNLNLRNVDSNLSEERLEESGPIYFGEGLGEDGQVPKIEESLLRLEDRQLTPVEPTEEMNVGTEEESRTLKIGTSLDSTQRTRMIDFLKEYQEVFARSYADMPSLDPSIVKHFLPLDTKKFPPKRQQLQRQRASLLLCIKEEVVKQINSGFLEVCNYSKWVANIVPPHIDILVDNTTRHAQFSFMDGFSGYNQIRMAEEDKIKTTFTTMWGTFCYRVMPFGLKNVGATYQRAMVTLFHDMMHKEVEVYVDDMIAKSKEGEDHLVNLKRLFDRLKEYKLRLNPAKCMFDARSGKLLGFVVSERDIEFDPDKDESTYAERAIYYMSKKFTEGESNYLEIEKMCCALVWVMQRLRQYTLYHTICLLSKADPLKYLLDTPSFMRNVAKWRYQLTEYDIEYVPRTLVKGQVIADNLVEFPIEDDTPINPDFADEGILQVDEDEDGTAWKMYFDGAVNSTSAAIDFKVKELEVFGDSMLTIFQTPGQWKTKDAKLVPYREYFEELAENFGKISFTYTPRIKNQFADALATLASMVSITKENLIEPLEIEIAKGPAYCDAIEATDEQPWCENIKGFL